MQLTNLNIILISDTLSRRQQIARELHIAGYTQVVETGCVADLFDAHKADYDVVVLDQSVSDWQTNAELVRYLTYSRSVPVWCHFILVSEDIDNETAQLPFRYLNTKVISPPLNTDRLHPLFALAGSGISYLKTLIMTVESADQRQVLENLKRARTRSLPAEIRLNLDGIVIRTLFVNGYSQSAFTMAAQIESPIHRYSAELLMSLLMGDRQQFSNYLAKARQEPCLASKLIYYRTYLSLIDKDYIGAREHFAKLPGQAMHASDVQAAGLLELLVNGFDSAMTYMEKRSDTKIAPGTGHHLFQLTGFVFLVINLLSNRDSGQKLAIERFALAEFSGFNTLHDSRDQLRTFVPYLQLVANILLAQQSGKALEQELERLMFVAEPLNSVKWLLLAAGAIGLRQPRRAADLLVRVDIALSKMEPCAEFISSEIMWQMLVDILAKTTDRLKLLRYLGRQLFQRKLSYRAMRRLYSVWQDFPEDGETRQKLQELMKRLSLHQYFELKQTKLESGTGIRSTA